MALVEEPSNENVAKTATATGYEREHAAK